MNSRQPGTPKGVEHPVLQALDLSQQPNVSPQFQMLQGMHETFARSLSNVLSPFLQSEIQVNLAGIRLTTMGDYQNTLPNPSCLLTLRLHPEPERVVLCLDCSTVLSLLDLLLGGTGSSLSASRELTEIEWSLLEEISRVIVRCLGESWQSVKSVEFVVESLGSDPSQVPYPDSTRSALRISFELRFAEQTGHFEIAVPCSFFEATALAPDTQQVEEAFSPVDVERNAHLLEDAEVELEVHLQGARLTFGELRALQQGQVIRFDHALHEPVRATVNGELSIAGHILSSGRNRAFQLEEISS
jgi:flagellar motor switch protein FliM